MNVSELPASVEVRLTDGGTLRGTLVEEPPDGWLLDEETGRLIHVHSQEVESDRPSSRVLVAATGHTRYNRTHGFTGCFLPCVTR